MSLLGVRWARSGTLPTTKQFSGIVIPLDVGDDDDPWLVDSAAPNTLSSTDDGILTGIPRIPPEDALQGLFVRAFVGTDEVDRVSLLWGGNRETKMSKSLIALDSEADEYIYVEWTVSGKIQLVAGTPTLPANTHVEIWTYLAQSMPAMPGPVVLMDGQVTRDKIGTEEVFARHLACDIASGLPDLSILHRHIALESIQDENILNLSATKIRGGVLDPKVLPSVAQLNGALSFRALRTDDMPTGIVAVEGNPSGNATHELAKLGVGETVYSLPSGGMGKRLLATSSVLPTAGVNGNLTGVTWTIGGSAWTGVESGTYNLYLPVFPEGAYWLVLESYVDGAFFDRNVLPQGANYTNNQPFDAQLALGSDAFVNVEYSSRGSPHRKTGRLRIQGANKTLPANATVKVYALEALVENV